MEEEMEMEETIDRNKGTLTLGGVSNMKNDISSERFQNYIGIIVLCHSQTSRLDSIASNSIL